MARHIAVSQAEYSGRQDLPAPEIAALKEADPPDLAYTGNFNSSKRATMPPTSRSSGQYASGCQNAKIENILYLLRHELLRGICAACSLGRGFQRGTRHLSPRSGASLPSIFVMKSRLAIITIAALDSRPSPAVSRLAPRAAPLPGFDTGSVAGLQPKVRAPHDREYRRVNAGARVEWAGSRLRIRSAGHS